MVTERPLAKYEKWYVAHENKKAKATKQPLAPKPIEDTIPNNVIYVDFKARKRIK